MDDHRIAGAILRRVRRELATLIVATSRAYAFSGGRAGTATNAMRRAERRVVKAQSALEEIMAKEHPAEWSAQVYYGGHESLSV